MRQRKKEATILTAKAHPNDHRSVTSSRAAIMIQSNHDSMHGLGATQIAVAAVVKFYWVIARS
ncbi:MAG: hypothetical protein B7Z82_01115 [Halothiobacillus sp. 20-54-6]|nr:MAG: hypothetical protein B7Z82_01115 [Halothiobacillus sp. 20-54-6]